MEEDDDEGVFDHREPGWIEPGWLFFSDAVKWLVAPWVEEPLPEPLPGAEGITLAQMCEWAGRRRPPLRSIAEAQVMLRRACGEGMIRSMKAPCDRELRSMNGAPCCASFERWTHIAPKEWREREVDYDPPPHEPLDHDGPENFDGFEIAINRDDFGHWLKQQETLHPVSQTQAKRTTGKRPRIKALLAEMYSNGVPEPGLCPRKDLQRELVKRDKTLNPLDDATLKAAIDEYNSGLIRNGPT